MNVLQKAKLLKAEQDRQRDEKIHAEKAELRKANAEREAVVQALRKFISSELEGITTRFGRVKVIIDIEHPTKICEIIAVEDKRDPPSRETLMTVEYDTWEEEHIGMGKPEFANHNGISIWHMPKAGESDTRQQTFSTYTLKTDLQEFERWLVHFIAGVI